MIENLQTFQPFIISLFLGALIGLERAFAHKDEPEKKEDLIGGIRTYSLIALFGCIASFLDANFQFYFLIVAFIGILSITVISYFINYSKHNERGITTEISILICFSLGIMVENGYLVVASFITILVVVILYLKQYLKNLPEKIDSDDIRATLKFAILIFIVLPIFNPDQSIYIRDLFEANTEWFENYPEILEVEVINPYNVWLMVVLISAISFSGYVAIKILGSRKGIGLTGFLGGIISSTATTLTFSRRSKEEIGLSLSYSLAVLLACSTMFPRVLVEVLIINPALLPLLSITMGIMGSTGFIVCFFIWRKAGKDHSEEVPHKNPFNIMPAVKFGLLYAVVVFLTKLMSVIAGKSGVYIVSALSGLTDVDAITLTMSQISQEDPSKINQAIVAITLAAFSNTFLKAVIAAVIGSKRLRKVILIGFSIIVVSGIGGLFIVYVIM